MWRVSEDKDVINSAHGVRIYKEYPTEMLTSGEYLKRIKEKRGKAYFRKLLQEEEKRSATAIRYFKSFRLKGETIEFLNPISSLNISQYIKVFYKNKKPILAHLYQNSYLTKSIKFNNLSQLKEIIDFETKTIKEYRYGKINHGIDEIECFYLKDICSVKEVSKIELNSGNNKRFNLFDI